MHWLATNNSEEMSEKERKRKRKEVTLQTRQSKIGTEVSSSLDLYDIGAVAKRQFLKAVRS